MDDRFSRAAALRAEELIRTVMAGLVQARPGHPRLFLPESSKDVDAHKPGHDELFCEA
jgi:hypothetical protein